VGFLGERDRLGHHVHAADYDGALDADGGAQGLELLADLVGELAGGSEDEGEDALWVVEEGLDDGQGEGAGLAGAGLGDADDVTAFEGYGKGLALDRRGPGPLELLAGIAELFDYALVWTQNC